MDLPSDAWTLRVSERVTLFTNRFVIDNPHNPYAGMAQIANLDLQLATDSSSGASADPQSQEEAKDLWKDFPWRHFPEYTIAERVGQKQSWVWQHGYDIQFSSDASRKRWVCGCCISQKLKKAPASFRAEGTPNIENHLFKKHGVTDPSGKRQLSKAKNRVTETIPSRNIVAMFGLDVSKPREQEIANALIRRFDKSRFQKLLIEWIVDSNGSFRQAEHPRLRRIFEYLNPSVEQTQAHIGHDIVRKRIIQIYESNKTYIIKVLKEVPGQIHVSFDGWRSRNRHALYGIICFYADSNGYPSKLVLGLPELGARHTGGNIAAQILEILESYEILDKIGYFTLDNASNMDSAMEEIGMKLGFEPKTRRIRCFGHVLNLVAKALLFGHSVDAFEEEVDGEPALDATQHEIWRKKGPIGKLHNLVHWIHRSDVLTYALRNLQSDHHQRSDNAVDQAKKPLDVVVDNQTRWLSTLYMIRRALRLRPFLEDLVDEQKLLFQKVQRCGKTTASEIPLCLRHESQLDEKDWKVIDLLNQVLVDFEEALLMLEGDAQNRVRKGGRIAAYGNIWDVATTYEYLLERLERWKETAEYYPDPEHFKVNVNLAWKKLDEYYTLLDQTSVYYAATILHPAYRWRYYENTWADRPDWLSNAKAIVQDLWEREYRTLPITYHQDEPVVKRRRLHQSALERHRAERLSSAIHPPFSSSSLQTGFTDEYERWLLTPSPGDNDVVDLFSYWRERRQSFPRLSRMAFDILSVPPMSAECERLFSAAGQMVSPLRTRMEASTIGIAQTLRSWVRNGLIKTEDSLIDTSEEVGHSVFHNRPAGMEFVKGGSPDSD